MPLAFRVLRQVRVFALFRGLPPYVNTRSLCLLLATGADSVLERWSGILNAFNQLDRTKRTGCSVPTGLTWAARPASARPLPSHWAADYSCAPALNIPGTSARRPAPAGQTLLRPHPHGAAA
jgi:hypothetical protein